MFCPRCDEQVRAITPWWGWKPAWHVWKVGFVLVLCLTPFLASDYCIMLPSTMLYLVSGGLLRGLAQEKPVCSQCSLELEHKERPPAPAATPKPA